MGYVELSGEFARLDGLVKNRLRVINDVTNDGAQCESRRGRCVITMYGRVLAEYGTEGLEGVRDAYQRLDAVVGVLWDCRRLGLARF